MRARERLFNRCGCGGCCIDGEPSFCEKDPCDLGVEYAGMYAERGALETATQNLGGTIAMLVEKDLITRVILRRKFQDALIVKDFDDGDWRHWKRNTATALGILAGPPCDTYVPSGEARFISDPRAQYVLGIGIVACALRPETIDIETLYGIAGGGGVCALAKIDEMLDAADYIRIVPSNTTDGERTRAATHGSAVFRNRVLLHYLGTSKGTLDSKNFSDWRCLTAARLRRVCNRISFQKRTHHRTPYSEARLCVYKSHVTSTTQTLKK